jgi:hypothetical protein
VGVPVVSKRTVKFSISLEKLAVNFEGDAEIAERVHGQISGALGALASVQGRLLPGGTRPSSPELPAVQIDSSPKRKKRRRKAADVLDTSSILDGETVTDAESGNGDAESTRRESQSSGLLTTLLTGLKDEQFFASKRTLGAIRDALSTKGHSYKNTDISPMLTRFTQKSILKREKNPQKQWVYFVE